MSQQKQGQKHGGLVLFKPFVTNYMENYQASVVSPHLQ